MIVFVARVRGRLPAHWQEWCTGLASTPGSGSVTRLSGRVEDQAALMGLLSRLHALNLQVECCTFRLCDCPPGLCTCHRACDDVTPAACG